MNICNEQCRSIFSRATYQPIGIRLSRIVRSGIHSTGCDRVCELMGPAFNYCFCRCVTWFRWWILVVRMIDADCEKLWSWKFKANNKAAKGGRAAHIDRSRSECTAAWPTFTTKKTSSTSSKAEHWLTVYKIPGTFPIQRFRGNRITVPFYATFACFRALINYTVVPLIRKLVAEFVSDNEGGIIHAPITRGEVHPTSDEILMGARLTCGILRGASRKITEA